MGVAFGRKEEAYTYVPWKVSKFGTKFGTYLIVSQWCYMLSLNIEKNKAHYRKSAKRQVQNRLPSAPCITLGETATLQNNYLSRAFGSTLGKQHICRVPRVRHSANTLRKN